MAFTPAGVASPFAPRFAKYGLGKIPLYDCYTTSKRAPHVEDPDHLVQTTTDCVFSCCCRQADHEGFHCCTQIPTQASLSRALASPDRIDQRSLRSLEIVPSTLSPMASDFVFFAPQGLYVYSAAIMSGAFFHDIGMVSVPPFLPGSTGKLSIGTSPLPSGGVLHVAGKVGTGPIGYPEVSASLATGIRHGGEFLSTKSSCFFNSVLAETNSRCTPTVMIILHHSDVANAFAKALLRTFLASMGCSGHLVRQHFCTRERVSYIGSSASRNAVTGWWTCWTMHPKDARQLPDDEVMLSSIPPGWSLDRQTSVITSGSRVETLIISQDKARAREILPDSEDVTTSLVYLAHRAALVCANTDRRPLTRHAPGLHLGLLGKGHAPAFYGQYKDSADPFQRPLSRGLLLLQGCLERVARANLRVPKDTSLAAAARAEVIRQERSWSSEPRLAIGTYDPYESMIRVGITAGISPRTPYAGVKTLSREDMAAWFCTPGRPPIGGPGGQPFTDTIRFYRGSDAPDSELPHVSGSSTSIFGAAEEPEGRAPVYPSDGMACMGADWASNTPASMESAYVFGAQVPVPEEVLSPQAETVVQDLSAGILAGSPAVGALLAARSTPDSRELRRRVQLAFPSTIHGTATLDDLADLKAILRVRANAGSPDAAAHDKMLRVLKAI